MSILKKKVILIFFSILLSISLVEIALNIYGIGRNNIVYKTSNYYGYYHQPNQNVLRRNKKITLDQYGNRNPYNNNFYNSNLFFLGDSVTYGGSVINNEESFSDLLAKKINKKYLNFSANGWGIINIINFIDFHNFYKENSIYILTCITECYTRNLRRLEQNNFSVSKNSSGFIFFLKHSYTIINDFINEKFFNQKKFDMDIDNEKTIEFSIKQLLKLNKKITENNSKLIILFSPDIYYFKKKLSIKLTNEEKNKLYYQTFIKKKFLENNIKFYNLADYFNDKEINNYALFFVDAVHLSAEGHKRYSKIIEQIYNDQR